MLFTESTKTSNRCVTEQKVIFFTTHVIKVSKRMIHKKS